MALAKGMCIRLLHFWEQCFGKPLGGDVVGGAGEVMGIVDRPIELGVNLNGAKAEGGFVMANWNLLVVNG